MPGALTQTGSPTGLPTLALRHAIPLPFPGSSNAQTEICDLRAGSEESRDELDVQRVIDRHVLAAQLAVLAGCKGQDEGGSTLRPHEASLFDHVAEAGHVTSNLGPLDTRFVHRRAHDAGMDGKDGDGKRPLAAGIDPAGRGNDLVLASGAQGNAEPFSNEGLGDRSSDTPPGPGENGCSRVHGRRVSKRVASQPMQTP